MFHDFVGILTAQKQSIWPKRSCAWPEKRTPSWYNFHGFCVKTVFPFWTRYLSGQFHDFEILMERSKDAIWPKRECAWPEIERFVQFSWKTHCFPETEARILRLVWRLGALWRSRCNAIWPKRAAHRQPERTRICTIFMESALVFPFWREFQAKVDPYFKNFDCSWKCRFGFLK